MTLKQITQTSTIDLIEYIATSTHWQETYARTMTYKELAKRHPQLHAYGIDLLTMNPADILDTILDTIPAPDTTPTTGLRRNWTIEVE